MSQFHVEINVDIPVEETIERHIQDAVIATLNHEKVVPPIEVTILLTEESHIQALNRQFAGNDHPTDVLSFPAGVPMPGTTDYLGDVAISIPTAYRQAKLHGHDMVSEIQLLAVHAILHLLGYDHADQVDRDAMWEVQRTILSNLGISISSENFS